MTMADASADYSTVLTLTHSLNHDGDSDYYGERGLELCCNSHENQHSRTVDFELTEEFDN